MERAALAIARQMAHSAEHEHVAVAALLRPTRLLQIRAGFHAVDDRIVATQLGFVYRDRYYCLILSRESGEWERYSVGRQLKEWMVKWCIAECGIKVFDLTVGDEPYKLRWTDRRLPLYELISPHTVNGMCFMIYRRVCIRMRHNRWAQAIVRHLSTVRRTSFFGKANLERLGTYSQ
jgi:CelD/BcsL family acetyltransferase involved in cellulose biosynthesis